MNNYEGIYRSIMLNYKYGGTKMPMAINNKKNPIIAMPEVPEDTASRAQICIWGENVHGNE